MPVPGMWGFVTSGYFLGLFIMVSTCPQVRVQNAWRVGCLDCAHPNCVIALKRTMHYTCESCVGCCTRRVWVWITANGRVKFGSRPVTRMYTCKPLGPSCLWRISFVSVGCATACHNLPLAAR
ncbi:hypothetical protein C8Q73DRAFT_675743 [Cubamyces lactineus]|nr:hypothetical protein C8Q73DRAFT_675743 [Cubamyces lactineus]